MLKIWRIKKEVLARFESTRQSFIEFCYLRDKEARNLASTLVEQEGKIDVEIEGLPNSENQRDLSLKFTWGHNHDFGDGFHIKGRMGDRHISLIAEFMTGFDLDHDFFKGKSCIDVGCWTGGTTLMLKHLGASEVIALEEVKKYGLTATRLCSEVYQLPGISSSAVNLYSFETDEKSDIAYFPGVVYHLSDPVVGLRRLFNGLKDGGICLVESAGLNVSGSVAKFSGNRSYHNTSGQSEASLNRGGWNWFLPSPACLEKWMVEAGFEEVRTYYSLTSDRVYGFGVRKRFIEICRAGLSVYDIP